MKKFFKNLNIITFFIKYLIFIYFQQEDKWNGLSISTPPYTICEKCRYDKCVPIDYVSRRGFHHTYKEK